MKLSDSFYQSFEGKSAKNIPHVQVRELGEDLLLLREGKTRNDDGERVNNLQSAFIEKFLRVFDRTVTPKLNAKRRSVWNKYDGVVLESPTSISSNSVCGKHLDSMLYRLGETDENVRAEIRKQFLSLAKLKHDPKYLQILSGVPEDEKWNPNLFRKGGLYEVTAEFPGISSERIKLALRLLRDKFDISEKAFQGVLNNCEEVVQKYSEKELLYYAADFFLSREKNKASWTYSEVREQKTRTFDTQNDAIKTPAGYSIGKSVSKRVFSKRISWESSEWVKFFKEAGLLDELIFGKKLTSEKIIKAFEYYDEGGHKKTSETKDTQTKALVVSQLVNIFEKIKSGEQEVFRLIDIKALSNSKCTILYQDIINKTREEVVTILKNLLEENKKWNDSFSSCLEKGKFLYGREETCKDAMDKHYEFQRRDGLKEIIDIYSDPDNNRHFSANVFRIHKVGSADFWRNEFGGIVTAQAFRSKLLYWVKVLKIEWKEEYERMFDWFDATGEPQRCEAMEEFYEKTLEAKIISFFESQEGGNTALTRTDMDISLSNIAKRILLWSDENATRKSVIKNIKEFLVKRGVWKLSYGSVLSRFTIGTQKITQENFRKKTTQELNNGSDLKSAMELVLQFLQKNLDLYDYADYKLINSFFLRMGNPEMGRKLVKSLNDNCGRELGVSLNTRDAIEKMLVKRGGDIEKYKESLDLFKQKGECQIFEVVNVIKKGNSPVLTKLKKKPTKEVIRILSETDDQDKREEEERFFLFRCRGISIADDIYDFLLTKPERGKGRGFQGELRNLMKEMMDEPSGRWSTPDLVISEILKWGKHYCWDFRMRNNQKALLREIGIYCR